MAKQSLIVKNRRRAEIVERYRERRAELKRQISSRTSTEAERDLARLALARLPRDSSPTRLRNRDAVDGRPRGFLRVAGVSRVRFRGMAHRGELPGITKSSW
ncbi:30S ribosomal protein S14 [Microlunatus sp. GCM10028923]|uniref:30S ribosomal protein S14 n=1 Tax=Microlunatus sp. GCM10028923 TaxID=3273400 RepID=UPI00361F5641